MFTLYVFVTLIGLANSQPDPCVVPTISLVQKAVDPAIEELKVLGESEAAQDLTYMMNDIKTCMGTACVTYFLKVGLDEIAQINPKNVEVSDLQEKVIASLEVVRDQLVACIAKDSHLN